MSAKDRETANVGAGLWKGWACGPGSSSASAASCWSPTCSCTSGSSRRDARAPTALDDLFDFFHAPVLVFLELMLVAAVLYHALNGVRIVLMDLGIGIRQHKTVFWVCMVVAAATLAVFAWQAFPYIF